jgi:hypothetical protein
MLHFQSRCLVLALFMAALTSNVYAVDGVLLIDQNRALAGNVTAGDAPGFPVSITQRGSYKLSGNLTVPDSMTTAIEISSDFVTIDLNGFSIVGPVDCSARTPFGLCNGQKGNDTGTGIKGGVRNTSAIYFNITIRNGSIQGMGNSGIDIFGDSILVQYMHIRGNGLFGMVIYRSLSGSSSSQSSVIVEHNIAQLNRDIGIFVEAGLVTDNVAGQNGSSGIEMRQGTAARNVCTYNGGYGLGLGSEVGYTGNTLARNIIAQVDSGVNLGQNLCGTVACP